jgi:uncharacterized protein YqeY
MDMKYQLESALKEAMKSGNDVAKRTIRMVLAAIRQVEIDRQVKLDETAILSIIQKEIKTRSESAEEARRANRLDVAAENESEIKVLQSYLPQAMTPDELKQLVMAVIAEIGATAPADLGRVMKVLMSRIAGRATGEQASQLVRQLLQS